MTYFDVLIIGASASGLMCAIEAGKRGRKVIVLDHAAKAGKKIRISGGGRCNFTNYDISASNYLSENKHFCKSALSRYQYYDFLSLLAEYQIPWHEREHGQLFCDRSANDIIQMLLSECKKYAVTIQLNTHIDVVNVFVAKKSVDSFVGENTDTEKAENMIIILEPEYPFSLDLNENATRLVKTLGGIDNTVIDYKIRVAAGVVGGENELKLKCPGPLPASLILRNFLLLELLFIFGTDYP